jgi:hypothetical protein
MFLSRSREYERYVDAHHIRQWADGGHTRVENLVLLCTQHQAVHEGGLHLQRDTRGDLYFITPGGKAIPACGRYETLEVGTAGVTAETRPAIPQTGVSAETGRVIPKTDVSRA